MSVLKGVLNSLEDTINSLLGSTLNPDQTFASAQAAYNDLDQQAISEGLTPAQREESIGDLTAFVTGFLEKAKEQFGSSAAFQNLFATVISDLRRAGVVVGNEIGTATQGVSNTDQLLIDLLGRVEAAQETADDPESPFAKMLKILEDIWGFFDGFVRNIFGAWDIVFNSIESILENLKIEFPSSPSGPGGFDIPAPTVPSFKTSSPSNNNNEIVTELRNQNILLGQLIQVTTMGLTIDGRVLTDIVGNIATTTFQKNENRNRLGVA